MFNNFKVIKVTKINSNQIIKHILYQIKIKTKLYSILIFDLNDYLIKRSKQIKPQTLLILMDFTKPLHILTFIFFLS